MGPATDKHQAPTHRLKLYVIAVIESEDTQIELHIDPNVQLVIQPHRRIPFHFRQQIEAESQRLEDLDIIEHVDGPTDCVLLIVVASKPKSKSKEIRICVDMRLQNLAIKCTGHIIPTIDDMIVDFNGARVFYKLNLSRGYYQMLLSPKSRNVTTFTTHVGLRRYKRLTFCNKHSCRNISKCNTKCTRKS